MKTVENEIRIHASIERVWQALTDAKYTKQYMFGCETVSDWKQGSELLWKGMYENQEMVFVSGNIIDIDAPNRLVYSVISPTAPYEKTPENHLQVAYTLRTVGEYTLLHVAQFGFEKAADGEKRYHEIYNEGKGWEPILVAIQALLENEK